MIRQRRCLKPFGTRSGRNVLLVALLTIAIGLQSCGKRKNGTLRTERVERTEKIPELDVIKEGCKWNGKKWECTDEAYVATGGAFINLHHDVLDLQEQNEYLKNKGGICKEKLDANSSRWLQNTIITGVSSGVIFFLVGAFAL